MKKINYIVMALIAAIGCMFTSCSDDENNLSRAVLASATLLEFETLPADGQIITVTSDADWYCEAPEWVNVTPASGHAGQTEVTITPADNLRDGIPDNPRKGNVLFRGRNLASIATVKISQNGDIFRDPVDYTITDMEHAPDETVLQIPGVTVVAVTANGFFATDGTNIVYVKNPETAVEVGQIVTIHGEKLSDDMKLAYLEGLRIKDVQQGQPVALEATDITANLDNASFPTHTYVSVTGDLEGNVLKVEGMNCSVYLEDINNDLGVSALAGHKVTVSGFFGGKAAPVVRVVPAEFDDLGINEIIYFSDDFEWIAPWALAGKNGNGTPSAGDTVGDNNESAEAPQISACVVDGVSCLNAFLEKGYSFLRVTPTSDNAGECIYLQRNYLKFGKTGYQAGITFPTFEVPEGDKVVMEFDWCVQRKGNGNFDPVNLIVVVEGDGTAADFEIPTHTFAKDDAFKWIHVTLDLSSVKFTPSTKVTIKQAEWKVSTANRWFLDNVKFKQAK